MSDFKFECPKCKQNLACDITHAGRQIQCPSCNVLIRIPPAPGHTASYQPESGNTWATHFPKNMVKKNDKKPEK